MHLSNFDIQKVQRQIENLELELTALKKLLKPFGEAKKSKRKKRIQKLRKQLMNEGFDGELVQLVGTVPIYRDDYKEEVRNLIYERVQS